MKDYYVTYTIRSRYTANVKANSIEEAMEKAEEMFCDADFGESEDIEGKVIKIEDEMDNTTYID